MKNFLINSILVGVLFTGSAAVVTYVLVDDYKEFKNNDKVEDSTDKSKKLEEDSNDLKDADLKSSNNIDEDFIFSEFKKEVESLDKLWLDNYEKYLYEYAIGNTNRKILIENFKNFYNKLLSLNMDNDYKSKLEELLLLEINYIEKNPNLTYYEIINNSEKLGKEKSDFIENMYK